MKIAIVTTGDEIMSGNVVDTNSAWIADKCFMLGLPVVFHLGIGDYPDAIGEACKLAQEKADIIFVTGGLGATLDDITVESAAKAFKKKMVLNNAIWKDIQAFFKKAGRECTDNNKRQAFLPEGGKALTNRVGSAPGVQVKLGKGLFFFLPGVPKELFQIFDDSIYPFLKEQSVRDGYAQKFLKCFGIPEASLDERIKEINFGKVRVSFRVTFPEVKIKLVARCKNAEKEVASVEDKIIKKVGEFIFGEDDDTIASVVAKMLQKKKWSLSVAESCTGGFVANMLTNLAGASSWFERGVVSYSNNSKIEVLGVKGETIKKFGAVSRECAIEMAEGIRKLSSSEVGMSLTGIAGPTGETKDKPLGTVHIAIALPGRTVSGHFIHNRGREAFKTIVAYEALALLRKNLIKL